MSGGFHGWFTRLARLFAIMGIVCLMGAILIVVVDVIFRRSLGWTVIGTVDLTQLCVMAAAFWSIPYAFMRDAHVRVDFITDRLPDRVRALLDGVSALMGLGLLGLLLWFSWGQAVLRVSYGDSSQDLGIPMIVYWGFLLSGCGLSFVATATIAATKFAAVFGRSAGRPA